VKVCQTKYIGGLFIQLVSREEISRLLTQEELKIVRKGNASLEVSWKTDRERERSFV
jgi:hypothetical protein